MSDRKDRSWHRMRPVRSDDVSTIAGWFESPTDLGFFAARLPLPMSPDALARSWAPIIEGREPRHSWFFLVEDPSGQPIAFTGIEDINYVHGTAITPLWVVRERRATGIGLVVRALILDLAFDSLGLHRVNSLHRADNAPSRRINELCGLQPEGTMREAWRDGQSRVDVSVFGILAHEWRRRRLELAAELPDDPEVRCGDDERTAWPTAARA
jgi:RimJ/RimL family protein N-acetyltransferase